VWGPANLNIVLAPSKYSAKPLKRLLQWVINQEDNSLSESDLVAHIEWLCGNYLSMKNDAISPSDLGQFIEEAQNDIQDLLAQGLDLAACDEDGKTAFEVAIEGRLPSSVVAHLVARDLLIEEGWIDGIEDYLEDPAVVFSDASAETSLSSKLNATQTQLGKQDGVRWRTLLDKMGAKEQQAQLDANTIQNSPLACRGRF
jgi:hypothetical protein